MPVGFIAQSAIADRLSRGYRGQLASAAPHHIGHGLNTTRQSVTFTPTAANATAYTLRIVSGGVTTDYTFTSDADGTQAEIVDGLVAAINAGTQPVTAVDNNTTLSLISDFYTPEFAFTVTSVGAGVLTASAAVAQGAEIGDGFFCVYDATISSDPMAVRVPVSSGEVTGVIAAAGFCLADNFTSVRSSFGQVGPGMVNLVRKGHVIVAVEEAVTANTAVYVRYAAGGQGPGVCGAGAGTSERALLNGAVYRSASFAVPGGLLGAVVEINIVGG
jgi:hypothetical protein